jgi:tRNA (guanine-N7-)-methyltransferase
VTGTPDNADGEGGGRKVRPLRSFGRLKGRPLSPRQEALLQARLPALSSLEGLAGEVWLEVGFGGGEHLAGQARAHPDVTLIGVEPFLDGVAKAVTAVDEAGLANVRILRGDAREAMAALPDGRLARLYVLFPDPWPKARHHKRRLVQPGFVAEAARLLAPGGLFRLATDWAHYADAMLATVLADGRFDWPARDPDDWRLPPADHVPTRYQLKGLGDCAPVFFTFRRM